MNNKRLLVLLAFAWLGMIAQSANAKGPEYTYAELGAAYVDADTVDGLGATVNISFAALDFLHLKLGFSRLLLEQEVSGGPDLDVDLDRFIIGMGGNYSVTDNVDVVATVNYVDAEYSGEIVADSDDGYLVEAGVRAMVTKKFELNAFGLSQHVGGDSDDGFAVGAVYDMKKFAFSGSVRYLNDDDALEYFAGLRIDF